MDILKIISDTHTGLDFGVVQYTVKKHEGEVSTIDTLKITSTKLLDNADFVAKCLNLAKALEATGQDATVTFSVDFAGGKAQRLMMQDTKHHTKKKWG